MAKTWAERFVNALILGTNAVGISLLPSKSLPLNRPCNTVQSGYQCKPELTHSWGQYSPWFSVPSEISPEIPPHCEVTFAQVLSRHGSRFPTAVKGLFYKETIAKIHDSVYNYSTDYAFIKDYQYLLGADDLTSFGQQEMYDSGINFFRRYRTLSKDGTPFVRASGSGRVVESALNWTNGFNHAKSPSHTPGGHPSYPIVVISESSESNNTLSHGLCDNFEEGPFSEVATAAQNEWAAVFLPPIQARLIENLSGVNLSMSDVISLMDLCPYNTVASPHGIISQFCRLFSLTEWSQYSYYQSLGKYYGYGTGNPLGSTQGVGFTNELIARLTGQPVDDITSTNGTLDRNITTFPLTRTLYADFSHDNSMISIFFAMGLYNLTALLPNRTIQTVEQAHGYTAAKTVPFAARAYIEKMRCTDFAKEEMVRVLVNDRVIPLEACGNDAYGRCFLSQFISSLSFAQHGGLWDQCFE